MVARPRYPTDHEPMLKGGRGTGWFDDFATVVGTRRPDAGGCWCMSNRDSRISNAERAAYMLIEFSPARAS
jgi:hypothetical protein